MAIPMNQEPRWHGQYLSGHISECSLGRGVGSIGIQYRLDTDGNVCQMCGGDGVLIRTWKGFKGGKKFAKIRPGKTG